MGPTDTSSQTPSSRGAYYDTSGMLPFHRLPDEIRHAILVTVDPPSFASLSLLNRAWRQQSNDDSLYRLQLFKLPSSSSSPQRTLHNVLDSDLAGLKRILAREARVAFWPAYTPKRQPFRLTMGPSQGSSGFRGDDSIICRFSRSSRWLAIAAGTRLFVLNLSGITPDVTKYLLLEHPLSALDISDDGHTLVAVSAESSLMAYRFESDGNVRPICEISLTEPARAVTISPDSSTAALAYEYCIDIFDLELVSHTKRSFVCAAGDHLQFSHDGAMLLSTSTKAEFSTVLHLESSSSPKADSENEKAQILPNCSHAIFLPPFSPNERCTLFAFDHTTESFCIADSFHLQTQTLRSKTSVAGLDTLNPTQSPDVGISALPLPVVSNDGMTVAVALGAYEVAVLSLVACARSKSAEPDDRWSSERHTRTLPEYQLASRIVLETPCTKLQWNASSTCIEVFSAVPHGTCKDSHQDLEVTNCWKLTRVDFGLHTSSQNAVGRAIQLNTAEKPVPLPRADVLSERQAESETSERSLQRMGYDVNAQTHNDRQNDESGTLDLPDAETMTTSSPQVSRPSTIGSQYDTSASSIPSQRHSAADSKAEMPTKDKQLRRRPVSMSSPLAESAASPEAGLDNGQSPKRISAARRTISETIQYARIRPKSMGPMAFTAPRSTTEKLDSLDVSKAPVVAANDVQQERKTRRLSIPRSISFGSGDSRRFSMPTFMANQQAAGDEYIAPVPTVTVANPPLRAPFTPPPIAAVPDPSQMIGARRRYTSTNLEELHRPIGRAPKAAAGAYRRNFSLNDLHSGKASPQSMMQTLPSTQSSSSLVQSIPEEPAEEKFRPKPARETSLRNSVQAPQSEDRPSRRLATIESVGSFVSDARTRSKSASRKLSKTSPNGAGQKEQIKNGTPLEVQPKQKGKRPRSSYKSRIAEIKEDKCAVM